MVKNNSNKKVLNGMVDLKKAITMKALKINVSAKIREKISHEYENFFILK